MIRKLFFALSLSLALLPAAASAQVVTDSSGKVEQGGPCSDKSQCAGYLICASNVCSIDYTAPGVGKLDGSVQPGGQCAYNYDCADVGGTQYSCLDAACKPDQGSVTTGSACETYSDGTNNCYGNLSCIAGICQVDSSVVSGTTAAGGGVSPGNATGAAPGAGSGGINLAKLTALKTSLLAILNGIVVPILLAVAFVTFLIGIYRYFILGAENETEEGEGRKFVLWSIIGFVVIFGVWGLVSLAGSIFGLSGQAAPPPPML